MSGVPAEIPWRAVLPSISYRCFGARPPGILLRNLREGHRKRPADGRAGVESPVKGDDYLAMLPGFRLVERQVHPFGFRTVDGFHSELMLLRRISR